MEIVYSKLRQIKPITAVRNYDDYEDAILDVQDFTDVVVNQATDINGYLGVSGTKTMLEIDYSTREARVHVYVYLEKNRK